MTTKDKFSKLPLPESVLLMLHAAAEIPLSEISPTIKTATAAISLNDRCSDLNITLQSVVALLETLETAKIRMGEPQENQDPDGGIWGCRWPPTCGGYHQ